MSGRLSGVFKQRKNSLKSPSKARKQKHAAAPQEQPQALASPKRDEPDDLEELLKEFDLDMSFGPCLGVSRMERWLRAEQQGLNPPAHVKDVLERVGGEPACVWEGKV